MPISPLIGQNQHCGYQLCVKHMNEKGGVLGRKLELVLHDDGSDPATAVRLYEKLITQDKVDLVLGPFGSPITDAVANVTEKHRLPMMTLLLSQWQDGQKVIVWPEELAPGKPRFPTPPWSQRP